MMATEATYLGFDLSTQQLKAIAVTSDLRKIHEVKFDFDADTTEFGVKKGVLINEEEDEVYAPVAMWLQALDKVLDRLKSSGLDFRKIQGISGAGMQHGSVFWSMGAESILSSLDPRQSLETQLADIFSHPYSPNWQDASTQKECDEFDAELGGEDQLAQATGSKAHHRFTGPQIRRFQRKYPDKYAKTSRISLVSSFLASILLGKIAPIDISDVCGMNLWDIKEGKWNEKLLALSAGSSEGVTDLKKKLGDVPEDGGAHLGNVSDYFVKKYGFSKSCAVIASTGDNPSTILALPLRENDAMVSLGTSTTFLMSTPEYKPDPATHFFNHPTTPGLYMFMLCYKNGGLAREKIRDAINSELGVAERNSWKDFDEHLLSTTPLLQKAPDDDMQIGLFFPRPEIVPNLPAGEWHYTYNPSSGKVQECQHDPTTAFEKARLILESQLLSLRLRSQALVSKPASTLPSQPRRIFLVGGGSRNKAIAKVTGEVLGSSEGVFKLDVGENACALGAAYKAVWAVERKGGEGFEELIGARWREEEFVEKIAEGYQEGVFEQYGRALDGFRRMERELVESTERSEET